MNWISVEEKLPPDGQEVLLFYTWNIHTTNRIIGYWLDNQWHKCDVFLSYPLDVDRMKVTHWMELPEYPKEQECKDVILEEINEIKEWLSNRPSPSLDPFYDELVVKHANARLRELKSQRRKARSPTGMMDAQTPLTK